ncbi:MAG: glycosyl hydrolase family 18 protein [Rhizomicrobium sp.]
MRWIAGVFVFCCQAALCAVAAPSHESDTALQRRAFVGYYPSWLDADIASNPSNDGTRAAPGLAAVSPAYSHIVIAFAKPDFSWNGDMTSWSGSGLGFGAPPKQIEQAIGTLHARKQRVLLAIGGATYTNWTALAAEGRSRAVGPVSKALALMIEALDFDGADVDYEREGTDAAAIQEYRDAIRALNAVVHLAGHDKVLTLAAWSTGADCTAATGLSPCGDKASTWPEGRTGRERLVFAQPEIAQMPSMVSVMSYDAGYETYDPVTSWTLYRALMPKSVIVNIGFEIAPEGWGDGKLVAEDGQALCPGSIILADQFGVSVNRPYSVDRLMKAGPLSRRAQSRDGIMLWHILKNDNLPSCGSGSAISSKEFEAKASTLLDTWREPPAQTQSRSNHDH